MLRIVSIKSLHRTKCGFTLIELITVIAIVSILAAMAYPNFKDIIRGSQLRSTASDMTLALRFARGASVKMNDLVTICRSVDGATCNTQPGFWEDGWIIFRDRGVAGTVDEDDMILRSYSATAPGTTLRTGTKLANFITYRNNGTAYVGNMLGNGTFRVCDHRGKDSGIAIVINNTGRIQSRRGTASCP